VIEAHVIEWRAQAILGSAVGETGTRDLSIAREGFRCGELKTLQFRDY